MAFIDYQNKKLEYGWCDLLGVIFKFAQSAKSAVYKLVIAVMIAFVIAAGDFGGSLAG